MELEVFKLRIIFARQCQVDIWIFTFILQGVEKQKHQIKISEQNSTSGCDGAKIAIGRLRFHRPLFEPTQIREYIYQRCICLGAQSFEHANVLSEKINFSALGGPGVAIFGPDDLHPMY